MRVLVVGNGAREHAIAKKLAQEDLELHAAMSRMNPGIARLSKRVEIMDINDPTQYTRFSNMDMAYIGPEAPLAAGIADKIEEMGVSVVGPRKALAKLEWSKAYTREVLRDNGIEGNPDFKICRNMGDVRGFLRGHPDIAVKPDVLTGGKGVKITGEHLNSAEEVEAYAAACIKNDGLVVLEERLVGREFTLQGFTDGHRLEVMPLVRDFKRAYDGDQGPNTGSMGSFSCQDHGMPDLPAEVVRKGVEIMGKTIDAMTEKVGEYKGVLYGGFMHTKRGVYLLEYNARFGDPEAINVLSLLETPLTRMGEGIADGRLPKPEFEKKATVCVYIVPRGYPVDPVRDAPLKITDPENSETYYASVYEEDGVIKTTGSRAIALLAKGDTVAAARESVYGDAGCVEGDVFYRKDIAAGV